VPLAKKYRGKLMVKVLDAPHVGVGMALEVLKANTADTAVNAIRFAKGIVIETAMMRSPTVPVEEQVRV
jgi:hypothetical protein